jgi:hypothetical protein
MYDLCSISHLIYHTQIFICFCLTVAFFLDKERTLHKNSFFQRYEIISCLVILHNALHACVSVISTGSVKWIQINVLPKETSHEERMTKSADLDRLL